MIIDNEGRKTVLINTAKLLGIVKENHEKHLKEYEEANTAFRELVTKELRTMLNDAVEGRNIRTSVEWEAPKNHSKDYLAVIRILELSEDSTVRLDAQDFRYYVMDEWAWSHDFRMSTMNYVAASKKG